MPWLIFEFVDKHGVGVIESWAISIEAKARLDQKIALLAQAGSNLPPKLLAGPIS